ncbi:MAG: site-specific DNA-methyltransferase [Promethearchaeota archaeon]
MVKLNWKNKTNLIDNIEELKKKYYNEFKPFNGILNDSRINSNYLSSSDNWINKLFWGDNLEVLCYLLNNYEEKIDLIYIDPPFFSGSNYHIKVKDNDLDYDSIAYYDHWKNDLDSYLQMLYERLILFKELLSKTGLIFVHIDWHASHYVRLILDEVFGQNRFVNNIVWYYYNKYSAGKKNLPRAHDNILVYSKSNKFTLNELRIPRKKPVKQLKRVMVNGVLKNAKDKNGHVIYRVVTDKKLDDVWRIPCMQPASKEWTGFPTQKHHELLERIIKIGSNKGDLIADFFCGSGTTLTVAENLNRKWIGCDISKYSIYLTYKRMIELIENKKESSESFYSFQILTQLDENRKRIIENGFFEKELKIRRKK